MHAYVRTAALGAAALALALSQQACSGRRVTLVDNPTAPAANSAAPSAAQSAGAGSTGTGRTGPKPAAPSAVLSGKRQVMLFPLYKGEEVPDSVLSVQSNGRVAAIEDFGDRALFVPVPQDGRFKILTGKLRNGGEASCLAVRKRGSNPLIVVTTACDASAKDQLFAFHKEGRDNQGRSMYGIENQSAYLQWNPQGQGGLIAEELGDAPLDSTFVLIDRGPATLPVLD
jgi:hypothetical protein